MKYTEAAKAVAGALEVAGFRVFHRDAFKAARENDDKLLDNKVAVFWLLAETPRQHGEFVHTRTAELRVVLFISQLIDAADKWELIADLQDGDAPESVQQTVTKALQHTTELEAEVIDCSRPNPKMYTGLLPELECTLLMRWSAQPGTAPASKEELAMAEFDL